MPTPPAAPHTLSAPLQPPPSPPAPVSAHALDQAPSVDAPELESPPFTGDSAMSAHDHESMEVDDGGDDDDSVVAPYPTMDSPDAADGSDGSHDPYAATAGRAFSDDDDDDGDAIDAREEKQAQLRSLMPLALRVQRRAPSGRATAALRTAPRIASLNPVPRPASAMPMFPATASSKSATVSVPSGAAASTAPTANPSDKSVSKEFDAFMDEMKSLGAL